MAWGLHSIQNIESADMGNNRDKYSIRPYFWRWAANGCFVMYVLNLCTLSPLAHATTLYYFRSTKSAASEHCRQSPTAISPPVSFPLDQRTTSEPLCCSFRGRNNKALVCTGVEMISLPQSLPSLVSWDTIRCRAGSQPHQWQVSHFFRPVPLYLVHGAFLL